MNLKRRLHAQYPCKFSNRKFSLYPIEGGQTIASVLCILREKFLFDSEVLTVAKWNARISVDVGIQVNCSLQIWCEYLFSLSPILSLIVIQSSIRSIIFGSNKNWFYFSNILANSELELRLRFIIILWNPVNNPVDLCSSLKESLVRSQLDTSIYAFIFCMNDLNKDRIYAELNSASISIQSCKTGSLDFIFITNRVEPTMVRITKRKEAVRL